MEWQALSPNRLLATQKDCLDGSATDICSLIHDINSAHDALLRNPASHTLHERFSSIRATVRRKLCRMENNWWVQKAAQIQSYVNVNDAKIWSRFSLYPVRSIDGALIKNEDMVHSRWAEYL